MAKVKDLDEGMKDLTADVKDARAALRGEDVDFGEAAELLDGVAESAADQADQLRRIDNALSGEEDVEENEELPEEDEDEDAEEDEDEDEDEDEEDTEYTYEDIKEMDLDELKEVNDREDLGVRMNSRWSLSTVRRKVAEGLDLEPEEDDDE